MEFYYNPIDKKCKSVIGAIPTECEVKISIFTHSLNDCKIIVKDDKDRVVLNKQMTKNDGCFTVSLDFDESGLFWYCFESDFGTISQGENLVGILSKDVKLYQLLVYKKGFLTPDWFKGKIQYQIFPDRFCKVGDFSVGEGKIKREDWGGVPSYAPNENGQVLNNDFFGGNFQGIISKLDYLKSLGVGIIYLNPIFEAYSNHRYDTGDYEKIDSVLGSEGDFKQFIDKAKEKGIYVILDGVFNHTGDDSKYFDKYGHYGRVGAYTNPDSKYRNWFIFEKYPEKYASWWGITTLPTINKQCHEYEDYIAGENGIIEKYAKMGVAGFRLDVVDEIPDSFVKKIRKKLKEVNPQAILIGEVWEDATNKIAYDKRRAYFQGEELDSVMNYELKNAILNYVISGNVSMISSVVKNQINNYPHCSLNTLMNFCSTHDTPRILTVLGRKTVLKDKDEMANSKLDKQEYTDGVERLKVVTVLLFTLYGVPSVYYGDEVGLEGDIDPFNRRCFPWGNENKEILDFVRKIAKIRSELNIFVDGDLNVLYDIDGTFIFERRKQNDNIIIAVNRGYGDYTISVSSTVYNLLSGEKIEKSTVLKSGDMMILYRKNLA